MRVHSKKANRCYQYEGKHQHLAQVKFGVLTGLVVIVIVIVIGIGILTSHWVGVKSGHLNLRVEPRQLSLVTLAIFFIGAQMFLFWQLF